MIAEAAIQVEFQVQTDGTQHNSPNHDGVLPDLICHELPVRSFTVYFFHDLQGTLLECGHRHLPPCPLGTMAEVLVPASLTLRTTHWREIASGGGRRYFENL